MADGSTSCDLTGVLSMTVQTATASAVVLALLVKRHFENPRRKWPVFVLDLAKQLVATVAVHLVNLRLASATVDGRQVDGCQTYLVALLLDVTAGMAAAWLLLRLLDLIFAKAGLDFLVSGNYFVLRRANRRREYFVSYRRWFGQCLLWCAVSVLAKVLAVCLQISGLTGADSLATLLLRPFEADGRLKLLAAVAVYPLLLNTLQYGLQDRLLRLKDVHSSDYEIVQQFYETVLERESHYQEYSYFTKQTELADIDIGGRANF